MFKHILLATDGSTASEHATDLALALARSSSASLTALFVIDPYPYIGFAEANPYGFDAYMGAARQQANKALDKVIAKGSEGDAALDVKPLIAEDVGAAHAIVRAAAGGQVDLVVIGSHGRGGVARLLLGSVASRVVAECSVPVLVAR